MITDPMLLEVHYASMLVHAAKRDSPRLTETEKRRLRRAANLQYQKALDALVKVVQKEVV